MHAGHAVLDCTAAESRILIGPLSPRYRDSGWGAGPGRTKLGEQRRDRPARHKLQEDVQALLRAVRALPHTTKATDKLCNL